MYLIELVHGTCTYRCNWQALLMGVLARVKHRADNKAYCMWLFPLKGLAHLRSLIRPGPCFVKCWISSFALFLERISQCMVFLCAVLAYFAWAEKKSTSLLDDSQKENVLPVKGFSLLLVQEVIPCHVLITSAGIFFSQDGSLQHCIVEKYTSFFVYHCHG